MSKSSKRPSSVKRASRTAKIATVAAGVGVVVGAAAALFTAPKKGKDLRKDVKRTLRGSAVELKKRAAAAEEILDDAFAKLPPDVRRELKATKARLVKQVAKTKELLTQQDYHAMVESALEKIEDRKPELAKTVGDLKRQWKQSYNSLKKRLS